MDGLKARIVDELEFGFGWTSGDRIPLTSHALAAGGGVWLIDPTDERELDDRVRTLGEPRGVIQLLDRHERGAAAVAARFAVPHHRVPAGGVAGAPFELVPLVRRRYWREAALWWPEQRVLVTADALGTVPRFFALGGEPIGVHPLLRLTPPRALAAYEPEHVLVGHGEGVHEHAAGAVHDALAHSRRRALRLPLELALSARRRPGPAGRAASAGAASRR